MILKFEQWLTEQRYRKDRIGDFARFFSEADEQEYFSKRSRDEHKGWADRVSRIAEPRHITNFNQAWQEYSLAKDAPPDFLD
jgi:hypothetical protein